MLTTTNKQVLSSAIARKEFLLPYFNPLQKFNSTKDPCVFEGMKEAGEISEDIDLVINPLNPKLPALELKQKGLSELGLEH